MKKEVYQLQAPPVDPFLVKTPSDLDEDLLRKYAYLETESYKAYRRKERRSLIAIIISILLLIGAFILLMTTDANTIDNFLM